MIKKSTWKIKAKNFPKTKDWLPKILAKNRGITTNRELQDFLNPSLEQILEIKITDIDKAIKRIEKAIDAKEKIIVYSDYDADGICATGVMWETLYDLGADVMPHVPHRIKEGYGLSNISIDELAKKGTNLIITVDHGVTAIKQVEHAKKLGIDVVITDHHVMGIKTPDSVALVHTTKLCGAGVAWRFCYELIKKRKSSYLPKLREKLDLAAIATIADLVPLTSANRAIVTIGLKELANANRPGLAALADGARIKKEIGTREIGHILAPRINAMGRIEHGLDALRLICTKKKDEAHKLSIILSKTNSKRQELTKKAITQAKEIINPKHDLPIVVSKNWHEGIIGLVAARLMENYHKPVIAIAQGEEFSKGSARSISGFNMVEAIQALKDLLVDGGGHPMAAGFTIETKKIPLFSRKINEYAQSRITSDLVVKQIDIECELAVNDITRKNLEVLNKFEPFGMANPEPIFITKNMVVEDIRTVGSAGDHLKLQLSGFNAIGFNIGEAKASLRPGYFLDLAFTLAEDKYNGNGAIQLKIVDMKVRS